MCRTSSTTSSSNESSRLVDAPRWNHDGGDRYTAIPDGKYERFLQLFGRAAMTQRGDSLCMEATPVLLPIIPIAGSGTYLAVNDYPVISEDNGFALGVLISSVVAFIFRLGARPATESCCSGRTFSLCTGHNIRLRSRPDGCSPSPTEENV